MAQAKMDFIINTKVDKSAFSELRREIQSLQALSEQDLIKMGAAPDLSSAKAQLSQIRESAQQVETALNKAFSPKLGTVSLSKFNQELKGMNLQKVANDFQKAGAAGQVAFRDLAANVLTTKVQLKESSKILEEFGQTMTNTIKWGISSSAFNTVTGSIQKAYNYAKNLDTSLNNIRIVAGQSADEMDRFAVKANKAAKELGKNTLDYTNAALIYYQQGTLNEAQIAERTATTLKMSNVTGEAAKDVSDYMTAVWNNFYDGSKSIEYYADVMTALGAATASSTDEIATGLEKFAAIADTVGLSFDYATAALATVTAETRQSAEVVGTAFKTMFARIQDLELGETLEDGVTLGSYSEALAKIGVSVLDVNGGMREMDDILEDMGEKWDSLSQAQKVATAEAVAGTRQYTQLVALMDNWDVFKDNLNTAANATGTLNEQQKIYMESTRAHLDQLSASAERLYKSLIDSEGLNDLIDLFSGLVTGIANYTEAIGGSKAALSQLGALSTKVFGKAVSQEIATWISNIQLMGEKTKEANAQLKLMQQFKGVKIDDASYQTLLDMTKQLEAYKNILTETQYQEAQSMIMARNEAANDLTIWEERRKQAEGIFKALTDQQNINLNQNPFLINAENLIAELDNVVKDYQEQTGEVSKEFWASLAKDDVSYAETHLQKAQMMLDNKIGENEELLKALERALNDYNKATANNRLESSYSELDKDQMKKLKDFEKAYQNITNDLVKNTNKVKETIKDAAKGTGESLKTQLELVDDGWKRIIQRLDIQSIAQGFMNLSGNIMMITSSFESLGNLPNIWHSEDLTTGEKILQTIVAVGNSLNGISQTMQLVHTTAEILNKTLFGNAGATALAAQAQKVQNEETKDAKPIQDTFQKEMIESKTAHDNVQKEIIETTQNTASNTLFWDKNTAAVRQNSAALVEQYNVRQKMNAGAKDISLEDELFGFLKEDVTENISEEAIDEVNKVVEGIKDFDIKLDNKKVEEVGKEYKESLIKGVQDSDQDLARELFSDLFDDDADDAIEGIVDKIDDVAEKGLNAKDFGLADDIVEGANKATDAIEGMEKAASGASTAGGAAAAGKGIFGTLKADLGVIGKALKMIPPQAWLVVAAIGAVAAAWKVFDYYSEENVLKRNLEEAQKAAENAKTAYEELKTTITSYSDARKNIESLTEGTVEFYEAVLAANERAEELIETLNLLPTSGYTIGANGLIQINEDVLENAMSEKMREQYRTQAHVAQGKADLEKVHQKEIIRDFMLAVNQQAAKQGSIAKIDQSQAKIILDNYNKDDSVWIGELQRAIEMGSHMGEMQYKTLEDINRTSVKNSEGICKAVGKTSENLEASIGDQEIKIGETIDDFLPDYLASQAKIDNYEAMAIENDLYSYLDDTQLTSYQNLSHGSQDAIRKIMKQKKAESRSNVQYDESLDRWGMAEDVDKKSSWWYSLLHPFKTTADWAVGKDVDKLKEEYLKETGNWEKMSDGTWKDDKGNSLTADQWKQKRNDVDIYTAIRAHNSGEYKTQDNYEKEVNSVLEKGASLAHEAGLSGTSSNYVTEALLRLKAGTADQEFFDLLTDEEKKALNKVTGVRYYENQKTGKFDQEIDLNGVQTEYSQKEVDNFLQLSGSDERSQTRKLADLEAYNAKLKETAELLGTTSKALDFYGKAMHKAEGSINDFTAESAEAIAQQYDFNKSFNKSVKAYYNNEEAINEYMDALEKEEAISYDVADAMGELAVSLEDMFGTELSSDFIVDNFKNIKKILTGTEEEAEAAYREIKALLNAEAITNTLGTAMTLSADELKTLSTAIANLNSTDLTLADDLAKQLISMVNNSKMTVEEMEALFSSLNLEVPPYTVQKNEIELESETIPSSKTTHHYDGKMIIPDAESKKGYKEVDVNYSWDEWTDEYQYSYVKINDNVDLKSNGAKPNFKLDKANTKAKTGSGGAKAKKEEKIEDPKDRYHDINVELKQIANELEKVQDEQDNLVGSDLIANLQRQYNLLNKEIDATARKIGIARGEQEELQAKLAGNGVNFNKDGTIANYAQAWDAQLAYVNSVIDKYNGMSAEAQEKYQETLDKAKENWNKFKENIDRYDTLITDDIPGLEADIRAALDQQIEIKLEAFEYEIKIRLDMSEAEREWNEFRTKIIDGIKEDDILGNAKAKLRDFSSYYKEDGTGEIQASTKHANKILEQLKQMDADKAAGVYGETYTYTNAQGEEVTVDYNNRKQALEDLKEYYTQIMDSMMELQELEEEIHQSYLDMMDEAQEKFDEQLETYQTIDEIIQHDMNLVKLMYGDSAGLAEYYKEQRENLNNQLDFQKQQVAFWKNQMDILEEGSDAWQKAKENWMAASSEWRALAEQNLQVITDQYLDSITTIFETLNNNVTNGMGLDYVSKEWDLINQNANRYLDQVNAIYETQSLQNKYLDAIEQSTNPAQQKKINELMEDEIALLQEKDKLSQYDIDRANLKYEIAMKQMALEESQQKKTQLRLRRDSQGNYTYQYTNDDSEVSKLKDELSDLYNQLYNLDAGQYKSNLDELYSVWEAYQADMYEAAQINDPEKRKEREEMLEREYGELINGIVADNESIKQNLQQSTASQLFDLYDQNAENYNQMTEQQRDILDNFISAETEYNGMAFDNLFGLYNQNLVAFETMTQEQKDMLMNDFIPQWNSGVQQMADTIIGEGGFVEVTKSAMEEIRTLAALWDAERKAAYEEAKAMAEAMQVETEELAKDNTELISTYQTQLEEVQKVIDKLGEMKTAYEKAAAAAKTAAEESYKYWQAASNQAASTDTTIKNTDKKKPEGDTKEVQKKDPEPPKAPSLSVGSSVSVKPGTKWYADSYGGGSWGYATGGKIAYTSSGPYGYNINGAGWIRKTDIVGYDTGGYTGEWNNKDGRLAMLHQKELVLNANDTKNVLNAVEILRSITSNLGQTLMNQMANISAGNTAAIANAVGSDMLEQVVHIDAQFPNVKNSNEIETALNNLVNMASQHIQKNR